MIPANNLQFESEWIIINFIEGLFGEDERGEHSKNIFIFVFDHFEFKIS